MLPINYEVRRLQFVIVQYGTVPASVIVIVVTWFFIISSSSSSLVCLVVILVGCLVPYYLLREEHVLQMDGIGNRSILIQFDSFEKISKAQEQNRSMRSILFHSAGVEWSGVEWSDAILLASSK